MDGTSAAATSDGRESLPPCVAGRATELTEIAAMRLLALCLGATVLLQVLALAIALLSPPVVHYIPEVGR